MKRKIGRGMPLEELVKGSLDYTLEQIRLAFRQQFRSPEYEYPDYWIVETFADHLIVRADGLPADEYYRVSYTRSGDTYQFAARGEWEVVELTYQPATRETVESQRKAKGGKRLVESMGSVELLEAAEGSPRRIKAIGITAGVVNGNRRRYPAAVLEQALADLQPHLNESAGQGRLLLLGEAEHPSSKGTRRPSLLETVVRWTAAGFAGDQVVLEGQILETSKGRDILALMEGGVMPGVSLRGNGETKIVKDGSQRIEEVTSLKITGFDLVLEPSDPNGAITSLFESQSTEDEMTPEELMKLIKDHPELFRGVVVEEVKKYSAEQLSALEEQVRKSLGVGPEADLTEALKAAADARRQLEEQQRTQAIDEAIASHTKELPYGKLNDAFVAAIRAAKPESAEAVKPLVEAKRKEYDAIVSAARLQSMGYGGAQVVGTVLEEQTGTPEFARAAFELTESIRKSELRARRDFRQPKTVNEEFTALYLEKFDRQFRRQLLAEAQQFEEAETTVDLNLPYSVSRAVIAEAFPTLVSLGIFDVGLVDASPTRVFYEQFAGDAGYTVAVVDEAVASDEDAWVQMANARLTPGTVNVEPDGGGVPFVEGSDYVIDYANGRMWTVAAADGGTIGDNTALDVDYSYTAIRGGEMATIERGEVRLGFIDVAATADRLADQISREAIVFSRSQIGWDAVSRTLASLINQVRRKIDQGMIYKALAAALILPGNSGGTWNSAVDPIGEYVEKVGVAKVLVGNRFYEPTFHLLSLTNADRVANWDGFTAAGKRPDSDLNAAGYIGRLKGLPCFQSTEMPDTYGLIGNRQLVLHRVFQAMQVHGPYPTYDVSGGTSKLVAADQYYVEEFNLTEAPVPQKGAVVRIS